MLDPNFITFARLHRASKLCCAKVSRVTANLLKVQYPKEQIKIKLRIIKFQTFGTMKFRGLEVI